MDELAPHLDSLRLC